MNRGATPDRRGIPAGARGSSPSMKGQAPRSGEYDIFWVLEVRVAPGIRACGPHRGRTAMTGRRSRGPAPSSRARPPAARCRSPTPGFPGQRWRARTICRFGLLGQEEPAVHDERHLVDGLAHALAVGIAAVAGVQEQDVQRPLFHRIAQAAEIHLRRFGLAEEMIDELIVPFGLAALEGENALFPSPMRLSHSACSRMMARRPMIPLE